MQREPHIEREIERALLHDSAIDRVRPFHIRVPQPVLDDLQFRIARTRWTRATTADDWSHGTDPAYLRELAEYWLDSFDWRLQERLLDHLPQFRAHLGELDMHFMHLRADRPQATPLVLLHGWPDSFVRYYQVGPLLAERGFDVVVPSLPGFPLTPALTDVTHAPLRRIAGLVYTLMTEVLGYTRFGVVAGDTGGVVAQILALEHPDAVIALHLSDLGWHAAATDPKSVTWHERRYLKRLRKQLARDNGYALVQSTRPRSLAPGLDDSPLGLASWIIDRFHAWSDGHLDERFGKDLLLTNIMLYWWTHSIASSMQLYFAEAQAPSLAGDERVDVPCGLALFPHDIGGIPPRLFAERTLAVVRWTEMQRGGHFGALEEPEAYAHDVVALFRGLANGGAP